MVLIIQVARGCRWVKLLCAQETKDKHLSHFDYQVLHIHTCIAEFVNVMSMQLNVEKLNKQLDQVNPTKL